MLSHKSYLVTNIKSPYIDENQDRARREQNMLLAASISLDISFSPALNCMSYLQELRLEFQSAVLKKKEAEVWSTKKKR